MYISIIQETMASFSLDILEQALADTRGSGVSFESQAKKWENEEQGECRLKRSSMRILVQFLNCFEFNFSERSC